MYYFHNPGPILDIRVMGAFFGAHFLKKKAFCLLAPPKQMLFLTISNENIFLKTQGTRLGCDTRTQQRSRIDPAINFSFH